MSFVVAYRIGIITICFMGLTLSGVCYCIIIRNNQLLDSY